MGKHLVMKGDMVLVTPRDPRTFPGEMEILGEVPAAWDGEKATDVALTLQSRLRWATTGGERSGFRAQTKHFPLAQKVVRGDASVLLGKKIPVRVYYLQAWTPEGVLEQLSQLGEIEGYEVRMAGLFPSEFFNWLHSVEDLKEG